MKKGDQSLIYIKENRSCSLKEKLKTEGMNQDTETRSCWQMMVLNAFSSQNQSKSRSESVWSSSSLLLFISNPHLCGGGAITCDQWGKVRGGRSHSGAFLQCCCSCILDTLHCFLIRCNALYIQSQPIIMCREMLSRSALIHCIALFNT